jgi:hypothetical protein
MLKMQRMVIKIHNKHFVENKLIEKTNDQLGKISKNTIDSTLLPHHL